MLNKKDRDLLKKLRQENGDDVTTWNYVNLLIPIFIIVLTLGIIAYKAYSHHSCIFGAEFFGTLFNGSLPLTAINLLLVGVLSYLKYNKEKEAKYGIETSNLRSKLYIITFILSILAVAVYISQAWLAPIEDLFTVCLEVLFSILLICIAFWISNQMFFLQESSVDNAFKGLNINGEKNLHQTIQTGGLLLKKD